MATGTLQCSIQSLPSPLAWSESERAYCRALVGIPYSQTGDTRAGCYCVGLVCLFYRDHNLPLPNPCSHQEEPVRRFIQPFFARVDVGAGDEELKYGDVCQLPESGGERGHLGIYTPDGILHATMRAGVVRSKIRETPVIAAFRHVSLMVEIEGGTRGGHSSPHD